MRNLLLLSFLLLAAACVQVKNKMTIDEQISAELGEGRQSLPSPAGSYTLFLSADTLSEADKLVKLMVVEHKEEKIILQDTLANVNLSWFSNNEILVEQRLGIVQPNTSANGIRRFVLNVENGQRRPLPENKKLQQ
ncbi:hypothetical protein [Nafulsella turpanensis]|uniref:hypothetical protein n=1 Tax=Nafulsella turpanensis TaxID=1265690 RepID=UPI00034A3AF8|nr:hypothetical protein [Nafulsella turpanensis]